MIADRLGDACGNRHIVMDEVGIAFAVIEDLRLRTAYQPIYRRDGDFLVAVAVRPSDVVQHRGATLPHCAIADLPRHQRTMIADLSPRLAVLNLPNLALDDPDIELLVALDAAASVGQAAALLRDAGFTGLAAERLIFDLRAGGSRCDLPELLDVLVAGGAGVSVEMGRYLEIENASRDRQCCRLVRLPARLFQCIMTEPLLRNLLPTLVKSLRRRRAMLQVEGIENVEALRVAIATGADRLQGDLLAKATLAGAVFDERPLSIPALIGTRDNVIAFSA